MLLFASRSFALDVKVCAVEWPGFVTVEKGQITGGASYEVLQQTFRRMGYRLIMDALPYRRCLHEVRIGNYDAMSDVAPRPGFIASHWPVSIWSNAVWVRNNSSRKFFTDLDSLRGLSVGLVRGYIYPSPINEFLDWNVDYATSDAVNLHKLAAGRIDVAIADYQSSSYYIAKYHLKVRPLWPAVAQQLEFVLFNEMNGELAKKFDTSLKALLDDGTVDRIYRTNAHLDFSSNFKALSRD